MTVKQTKHAVEGLHNCLEELLKNVHKMQENAVEEFSGILLFRYSVPVIVDYANQDLK